ncbi:hypothetical protein [Catellatospora tritici]|uniref:hypothetical protein n=1 Tax=Catellatospora tritici TaxID=2851566 RepID=UPI001C2D1C33|nr:hypothetical protein [Catellatospora tritici]MBV1852019.1 hypothetical protein [Catellatospora tritici]
MNTPLRRALAAVVVTIAGVAATSAAPAAAGWLDTPWNDQPQGAVARPTIQNAPDGQSKAARFYLAGGQQRNESQPTAAQNITEGQTHIVPGRREVARLLRRHWRDHALNSRR